MKGDDPIRACNGGIVTNVIVCDAEPCDVGDAAGTIGDGALFT